MEKCELEMAVVEKDHILLHSSILQLYTFQFDPYVVWPKYDFGMLVEVWSSCRNREESHNL